MSDKNRKIRLDQYLVQQGLVVSRHRAADLIKRRQVKLNQKFILKPAYLLNPDLKYRIQIKSEDYVTRAGEKLARRRPDFGALFYQ